MASIPSVEIGVQQVVPNLGEGETVVTANVGVPNSFISIDNLVINPTALTIDGTEYAAGTVLVFDISVSSDARTGNYRVYFYITTSTGTYKTLSRTVRVTTSEDVDGIIANINVPYNARKLTDRRSRTLLSTIELENGDGVPADLHDSRVAGSAFQGVNIDTKVDVADPTLTDAMIQNSDYGTANGYGQEVMFRHLNGGQVLSTPLTTWHVGQFVAHAVRLCGKNNTVAFNWIERVKGDGITLTSVSTAVEPPNVATIPVGRVYNNLLHRIAGSGIIIETADTEVRDNLADIIRDYGAYAKAGNTRFRGNHLWGCGIAAIRLGVDATTGACSSCDDNFSDSPIGLQIETPNCSVLGGYAQGCITGILVNRSLTHISATRVRMNRNPDVNTENVAQIGVDFTANANTSSFRGGGIGMEHSGPASDDPDIGIRVQSHLIDIDTTITANGSANQIGIYINAPNLQGAHIVLKAWGFTGADSAAVQVNAWGGNNILEIRGLAGEHGTPPTSPGSLLKIDSSDWGTNTIIIDNVTMDPGTY